MFSILSDTSVFLELQDRIKVIKKEKTTEYTNEKFNLNTIINLLKNETSNYDIQMAKYNEFVETQKKNADEIKNKIKSCDENIEKIKSMKETLSKTSTSIIVSAFCFFAATFGVAMYSKIDMIASICNLLARGSIISMLVVILILPSLLLFFDKFIMKTTKNMKEGVLNEKN